jgi:hypothetical protein
MIRLADLQLADLQDEFQAFLLDRPNQMPGRVKDTARADGAVLLAVYRHAYTARLIEALGQDFDVLRQIVGDEVFGEIGQAYVAAHPSRHFSLGPLGQHLPAFLASTAPWSARPYLGELAAFEWALRRTFDAADAAPITVEALASVPPDSWPGLTFRLLPSFVRVDLAWDMPQAWQTVQSGANAVPLPTCADAPVGWAIWRPALVSEFRSLDADEAWALDALASGQTFAALCEGLCRWVDAESAPARAAGLLRGWIEQGMVAGVKVATRA